MANVKISDLTAAGSTAATDQYEIETGGGVSLRSTAAQLLAYIQGAIGIAQSQVSGLVAALAALATADAASDAELAAHEADTTNVHGIVDTAALLTTASAAGGDMTGTLGNLQIAASAVGTTEIAADAVTYAKIQNVSTTDKLLGRSTAGAGDVEEIACTAAARSVLDDSTTAAMLTTLGAQAAVALGRYKSASTTYYSMSPLCSPSSIVTPNQLNGRIAYEPWLLPTAITVDRIAIEITSTAAAAGKVMRLGIYNADADWQPTTLVLDAGTVAADSTGVKAITISQALPAGRYLLARTADADVAGLRGVRGGAIGVSATLGANLLIQNIYKDTTYAAFAGTGVPWDSADATTSGQNFAIFMRVSTP